jgi:uncharacterized damage-inducible protein DinB
MTPGIEVWLRGPVEGVPPQVQPVAHALLQVREEVRAVLRDFPADRLWNQPAGVASVGFHLQHICGVIDRLFTYARGESLSDAQRRALDIEGRPPHTPDHIDDLLGALDRQVDRALTYLREVSAESLTDVRMVGRKQLPSTTLGLLFHAAEHSQRHLGQMLVTARILTAEL